MAGVLGFEPRKCQIQSLVPYRLATAQYKIKWGGRWDSNPRSPVPQTGALTNYATSTMRMCTVTLSTFNILTYSSPFVNYFMNFFIFFIIFLFLCSHLLIFHIYLNIFISYFLHKFKQNLQFYSSILLIFINFLF